VKKGPRENWWYVRRGEGDGWGGKGGTTNLMKLHRIGGTDII